LRNEEGTFEFIDTFTDEYFENEENNGSEYDPNNPDERLHEDDFSSEDGDEMALENPADANLADANPADANPADAYPADANHHSIISIIRRKLI
jgi:hypothetical protein